MSAENTPQAIPLGRQLRKITQESKSSLEVQNFTNKLVEVAQQGLDYCFFEDLRDYLPTLIMNETLFNWLQANELIPEGGIDQSTGNYRYTIKW